MTHKYRVVVVGMGKRGMHHALAFQSNGKFEVAGVCDVDNKRLAAAAAKFGGVAGNDAFHVASAVKPDVFCFCTLPRLRAEMVRIGIESGARLIAFEKPIALNSREGMEVKKLLAASIDDLQVVEGVGEARARSVREGLSRLAESSILERYA